MVLQDNLNIQEDISDESPTAVDAPKVLLIEDTPSIQKIHKIMLLELGCEVDVVSSGEDALLLLDNPYDVILLDINLPGINGIEVASRIREHEHHLTTRLIAITTNASREIAKACFEVGVEQVLMKPVDVMEFSDLFCESDLD